MTLFYGIHMNNFNDINSFLRMEVSPFSASHMEWCNTKWSTKLWVTL